ncbi:MAG: T9SS type A sorting domain-containing protein [Balneolaceae bacterium]|nr:T9SS type A sorting domain-containing protein [Balneolaceae bacterium]
MPIFKQLNQEEYVWEPVENDDAELNTGDAVIAYVYGDDDNNGSDDGFPKTLTSSTGNWLNLDGSYEESFFYDPDQQETEDSFYLWGNPYPIAIDLCEADLNNIPKNAYFWNPAANDGNGDYMNLSCDGGDDVVIAPFQSIWLRLTDANNSMELPAGTYVEADVNGYFKDDEPSDRFLITMNVNSEDQQKTSFTNTTRILFDDEASTGSDLIDAPKLSSAGLAQNYLSFYSLDEENNPYALQALPTAMDEKIRIPLDIQTTESGRFTMDWNLPESHTFIGSYFLRDNETGEVMELREGSTYSFEINPEQTSKVLETLEVSGEERSAKSLEDFADLDVAASQPSERLERSDGSTPRFELLIASVGVDGLTELGATPDNFTLAQNYPNPFNPTTVISYQLPVSSEVRLEVYDMLGRNVATLVNEQVSAGRHTVNFDARNLSSGVYLYRLVAGSQIMTRKLTILK